MADDGIEYYKDPTKGYWGKTKMMAKYRKILNKMYALQRHREIKAKMKRKLMRPIKAPRPFFSVQCDLAFWDRHERQNDGVIGLLLVIDVFSRYLWVKKIYNKKSLHIGLKSVIERMNTEFNKTPLNMTADNEFDTKELDKLASIYGFEWYFSDSGEKYRTGIVERVVRTMRNLIKRYQTQNNTIRYVDVLPSLVKNYNNTEHRVINNTPHNAITTGKINDKRERQVIPEIETGEKVRVEEKRKVFDKGDKPYYSKNVYNVAGREGNRYVLKDEKGKKVSKKYGRSQLYHIDKVIPENEAVGFGYDEGNRRNVIAKRNKRALKRNNIDLKNIKNKKEREDLEQSLGLGSIAPKPKPKAKPINMENVRKHRLKAMKDKMKQHKKKKKMQEKIQTLRRSTRVRRKPDWYKPPDNRRRRKK